MIGLALLAGMYDIVHQQCPGHVVTEYVQLAKQHCKPAAAKSVGGLVNGVSSLCRHIFMKAKKLKEVVGGKVTDNKG